MSFHQKPLKVAVATLLMVAGAASAQTPDVWPKQAVRVVVGFSPGGPTDVVARAFAEQAAKVLGQPVIVENKPGANTILAAEAVARATPDGYTVLFGATNHTMIPALYRDKIKFDALESFTPICAVAASASVLVTGPSMKVTKLSEFMDKVKAEPGVRTYATPGTGSSGHFAGERFQRLTHTSLNHIPYKGAAQAVTDLMGGQVDASFATLGSVLPQIRAGKLTPVAVAAPERSPFLPDVPTFDESGVSGFYDGAWYGLLAPAGIPELAVQALTRAAVEFAKAPATKEMLDSMGMETREICGEAFRAQLKQEITANNAQARELNLESN